MVGCELGCSKTSIANAMEKLGAGKHVSTANTLKVVYKIKCYFYRPCQQAGHQRIHSMSGIRIAILGGGNLGSSMATGLVKSGFAPAGNIAVTRRSNAPQPELSELGIATELTNAGAVTGATVVILAVKPKHLPALLAELAQVLIPAQLVVSVATGISIAEMAEVLGNEVPLFRAMPNTATSVRESITCLATHNGTAEQQQLVTQLFDALGKSLIIDEELFQAATVLGACGIAYALRFIRAMSQGGIEIGFGAKTAEFIATQTLKGATEILLQTGNHPEREIDKVTTPQGCTIAGLNEMEHRGFTSSLIKGIGTSYDSISGMKNGE